MKLIVGLGNPLEKYEKTRHNVGFILLDDYSDKNNLSWTISPKLVSQLVVREDFILCKPQTYMNNSGDAVSKVMNYYKLFPTDLVVIHDDVDLEFARTKRQFGSSAAGHHGVENIFDKIGTQDFWRIRVGVGRPKDQTPVDDFVLNDFTDEELKVILGLNVIEKELTS